jgi:hypothetical protein
MTTMATWEDGPEYAPLERPAEFSAPTAAPLDEVPPVVAEAASAPAERPHFTDPAAPVAPLAALVPVVADVRDPGLAFDVVSSNLTSGSAWGSAHGGLPAAGAAPAAPAALPMTAYSPEARMPPPPVAPQQWPSAAPVPGGYPPPAPGAFPAPGTPQWFGPGPYAEPPPGPARVDARRVLDAATPALLVVLLAGGLFAVLSPLLVAAGFALRSRVRAGQQQVRRVLAIALGAVGFFGVVGLVRAPLDFGEWWAFVGFWSLLVCWATLVSVVLLVRGALLQGPTAPPPPYPNPWR